MSQNKSSPWRPHRGLDLALTHEAMETGSAGVSCGVQHQGVSVRSFESYVLGGEASIDHPCSSTSQRYLIGLGSEECLRSGQL